MNNPKLNYLFPAVLGCSGPQTKIPHCAQLWMCLEIVNDWQPVHDVPHPTPLLHSLIYTATSGNPVLSINLVLSGYRK